MDLDFSDLIPQQQQGADVGFDDLVPQQQAGQSVSFDDLIPAGTQTYRGLPTAQTEDLDALERQQKMTGSEAGQESANSRPAGLPTIPQPNDGAYLGAQAIRPVRGQESAYTPDGRVIVPGQGPIGAAGAQTAQSAVGSLGALVGGVGGIPGGLAQNAKTGLSNQLAVMDRIDAGEQVPATDDPLGYGDADEKQRAAIRADVRQRLQGWNTETDPNALQRVGKAINDYAQAKFPVDSTHVDSTLTKIGGAVGGLPVLLLAARAGGPAAAAGIAGLQSFDHAYQDAKGHGASEQQAYDAAFQSGLVGAGLMLPNAAVFLRGLPVNVPELGGSAVPSTTSPRAGP
jgi:hypothetical protein